MPDATASPGETDARARLAGPGRPDQRLGRALRIAHSGVFQQAYEQGRRYVGSGMVMWLRSGEGAALRLGVVASRKVGDAVDRARAKRRLREAYRRNRYRFHGAYDVVLIARRALLGAPWPQVESELLRLASRAGILERPAG